MSNETPELSIVILNYNVKELLLNCLESIFKNKTNEDKWQVIVVDNASSDGSTESLRSHPFGFAQGHGLTSGKLELVESKVNIGFAAGNNLGVKKAKAQVVLFLNPDTVIVDDAIQKTLEILLSNPDYGAVTCKVELPNGKLDYSCHRGFPTPWNSLMYFIGLAKIFPQSSLFAGYTATYLDINTPHEIDCVTGAFLMVRKIAGDQISWWDQDYFWNGEDIEFCYSLKEKDWKVFYYPEAKIIHFKGSSAKKARAETINHGISAMRIFYKKHYYKKYPPVFRDVVLGGIKFLEHWRKLWI